MQEKPYGISVLIITLNEERNIARAIESVLSFADEIIIVDAESTDSTKSIATGYEKVQFIVRPWEGYSSTKNYLHSLANYSYLFSLDADEAPDCEMQNAIIVEKKQGLKGVYEVNRLTNYCGSWIRHSGWYPDIKKRLFPCGSAHWDGAIVHEELVFDKEYEVIRLGGHLEHYSYYSFEDHQARADKYSLLTAKKFYERGKKAGVLKPYLSGCMRFISMYLVKLGFLDGKMGFWIAWISAKSNVLKYKELRRLNKGA
ncbi:MAG: glycosyltransferase family 2 protein [Crocinitomicaceae bacterium]|nr:glycosyltransferase family 2 protein [Crocinitomicaceae bacterium]